MIVVLQGSILHACLFVLWFKVPVNNYGHVQTVGQPNDTVPGQA